jgi:multidrug efflux pump
MTRILRIVLNHRLVVFLLVVIVSVTGSISYYLANKQEYPDIAPPIALITTAYPGAIPADVERLITRKIEEEIESIPGFLRSNSRSLNGLSVVVLELEYGTNINDAWRDLRNQLTDLQKELPEGADPVEVNTKLDETAGFIFAVTSHESSADELRNIAEGLKAELSSISGVARVELQGDNESQVRIRVNTDELNHLPLSMDQVSAMIQAQAATIPLGDVSPEPGERIRVNLTRGIQDLNSLEQLVLISSPETGATLRLGQIADIQLLPKPDQQQTWHNGIPAILVTGFFAEERNVLFIGAEIQQVLQEMKADFPDDVTVAKVLFQPDDIAEKVNTFALNLLQGILFVILVVLLGMGFRNSLVVSSAIPLSILLTISVIRLFDISIHQISIAALIIALGMLVDNAIVVSDAIQVRMDQGEERRDACIQGTRDVTVPVMTSTLTTIGAFIPLLMLDSLAGDFIRSVPQIVMIALGSSYLVSVFFIPTAALMFFRPQVYKGRTVKARQSFYRVIDRGIKNPRISLLILAGMAIVAFMMAFQLGLQFFPKADTDLAYIDLRTESDQGIEQTVRLGHQAAEVLAGYQEIIQYSISAGNGFPKFYNSLPTPLRARNYAQIMFRVDLKGSDRYRKMSQLTDALQREMDSRIVGARVDVKLLEQADPIAAPVLVRISGGTDWERREAALAIKSWLERMEGTINVQDDDSPSVYEYQILPKDESALRLGITRFQLTRELNLGVMGQTVGNLSLNDRDVDLYLQGTLNSKEEMENYGIRSTITGRKVPLRQIALIDAAQQSPSIRKVNGRQTITVQSDVMTGYNAVNIQNRLQQFIENNPQEGVRISYAGEREEIIKYFGEVGVSAVFAVMIVFVILVLQFGGLRLPLLILLTIPFSAIGSVAGLWIFRQPLSFTALLGMVSLFGIVVNNAIILLDYIQYEIRQGQDALSACRQAVALRLRPILLTTATTVMGLLPLILSGSDLFTPMAISLMAGLIVSTFLTLVVLPVMYLLTDRTVVPGQQGSTD